jgi:hypothetical protein
VAGIHTAAVASARRRPYAKVFVAKWTSFGSSDSGARCRRGLRIHLPVLVGKRKSGCE